jgi:hypothetical protein
MANDVDHQHITRSPRFCHAIDDVNVSSSAW